MICTMSKEFVSFFMQVCAFALGGFAAFLLGFKLVWPRVEAFLLRLKIMHRDVALEKDARQMQFAAYERLLVLAHRMEPMLVLARQHQEDLILPLFVSRAIQDIESEYQHNFAQQLYVSDEAWNAVTKLKVNTILLLRNVLDKQDGEVSVDQYVADVLGHVRSQEQNPYQATQKILKREING
ncbi:hypothetical protein ACFSSD_13460 [Sphingobacterium griseoflavum]